MRVITKSERDQLSNIYYKVLQIVTESYYKAPQILQSVTEVYYKVPQVLQRVRVIASET